MEAVPLTLMMARSAGRAEAHARSRLHHRARRRRRRLGHQDGRRLGPDPGPAHVHRRPLDRPDRRPQRPHAAHRHRRSAVPVLQRHGASSATWPTARTRCARAVREQMRQGADQIKLMVSGGVASPYDPLESLQFTRGRDQRRGRGGARLRPLRADPRLHARGHHRAPSNAACAPSSTAI